MAPRRSSAVDRASSSLVAAVRRVLRRRKQPCTDSCPGWFISADTGLVERCDECASLNHYDIADSYLAVLPEVWQAMRDYSAEFETWAQGGSDDATANGSKAVACRSSRFDIERFLKLAGVKVGLSPG